MAKGAPSIFYYMCLDTFLAHCPYLVVLKRKNESIRSFERISQFVLLTPTVLEARCILYFRLVSFKKACTCLLFRNPQMHLAIYYIHTFGHEIPWAITFLRSMRWVRLLRSRNHFVHFTNYINALSEIRTISSVRTSIMTIRDLCS